LCGSKSKMAFRGDRFKRGQIENQKKGEGGGRGRVWKTWKKKKRRCPRGRPPRKTTKEKRARDASKKCSRQEEGKCGKKKREGKTENGKKWEAQKTNAVTTKGKKKVGKNIPREGSEKKPDCQRTAGGASLGGRADREVGVQGGKAL